MPGPSNLYGVATPNRNAFVQGPMGDFLCPAGVVTTVLLSAPVIANSPGYYYPIVWGEVTYVNQATPPSDVYIGLQINGGSFVDHTQSDMNYYGAANAGYVQFFCLVGSTSNTLWAAPGSTIGIGIEPFTQPVQYRGYSPRFVCQLFRAADQ